MINNQPADGEDVSWIWDTELEKMDLPSVSYAASGSCREQIAQRLEAAHRLTTVLQLKQMRWL